MGQLRFRVPESLSYDERIWKSSVVTGIEGIPWPCRIRMVDDVLSIDRTIDESGKLSIVWPTHEFGPITVTSSSLRCDENPYDMAVELARGTLHRVRGRALDWQRQGLSLPDSFCRLAEAATDCFLDAISTQRDTQDRLVSSQRSIELSLAATRPLTEAYIQQSLQARHHQEEKLSTLLGFKLDSYPQWLDFTEQAAKAINLACISLEWGRVEADSGRADYDLFDAQFEWARKNNMRVCGGPLVSLQPHAMPQWLYLLNDFDTLLDAACAFTRKTVQRYKGKVHLWSAAAGLNSPNNLGLTDEQVLRLAVGIIQTVRRTDDRTPVVLHLDMPWAEYLAQSDSAISPLHLADALIRAELGLSGLCLDLNMNVSPGGSLPRDLIDLSDLVDRWSELRLPLIAAIQTPATTEKDPKASNKVSLVSQWKHPSLPNNLRTPTATGMPPTAIEMTKLLLAKPNVHGIVWTQATDSSPHHFPNGGLFGADGAQRSSLEALVKLRQQHLT